MEQQNNSLDMEGLRSLAADISGQVESAMRDHLDMELQDSDPFLGEVLRYSLFNGGKRIRPMLVVLCSRCCGRDDKALYRLAAAFEYLHVATLVHDDVIDKAPQRRGVPSVYARYGADIAILAGDWLHARSMYMIGAMTGVDGLEVFCDATGAVVNGEFEQIRHAGDPQTEEHHYFRIIRQKTGNLITAACIMGGLYAGADAKNLAALKAYGDGIGAAFQVVDDLLDYQGESKTTGKIVGNDFIEGKMTLPVLRALAAADSAGRSRIEELIRGDRSRPEALTEISGLIERFGGFASAAATGQDLIATAIKALAGFNTAGHEQENATWLQALARYILIRKK